MNKQHTITGITLWVNRGIIALMVVLFFTLDLILNWYSGIRNLLWQERFCITVAFYLSSVAVFIALLHIDRLMDAIIHQQVFIPQNVKRLRRIRLCCGIVSLICLPAAFAYLPLIFLVVVMAFLCLCMSVVCCVMDAAVSIREENDLTI